MKPIIKVENLSKQYRIGTRQEAYSTLRDTIAGAVRARTKLFRRNGDSPVDTIWALKDVSFEVQPGEVLGIIGKNGAGKSTLLKVLSRITEPTTGRVEVYGRLGSLLEVGTGFHPELTGRENIYLNGSILGITRKEITQKLDEIIAFSEVEKFIDTPVKRYSSGMYVRLAFAVAAHLDPEILILDEVLSVGDAAFQTKCLGKMGDVARRGRTVLFVSHNMHAVRSLCTRSLLLESGRATTNGDTEMVVSTYLRRGYEDLSDALERTWDEVHTAPGDDEIRLRRIRLVPASDDLNIEMNTPLKVEIEYWNMTPDRKIFLDLCLYSLDGSPVLDSMTAPAGTTTPDFPRGLFRSSCYIPGDFFNEGNYRIRVAFIDEAAKIVCDQPDALMFAVNDSRVREIPWYGRYIGFVHPKFEWRTELLQLEADHSLRGGDVNSQGLLPTGAELSTRSA